MKIRTIIDDLNEMDTFPKFLAVLTICTLLLMIIAAFLVYSYQMLKITNGFKIDGYTMWGMFLFGLVSIGGYFKLYKKKK